MPAPSRRSQMKNPETRAHVRAALVGALERLLEQGRGINAVSVEQLAREAGIARATFYLHFRDRADLVQQLMAQVTDEVMQAASLWYQQPEQLLFDDFQQFIGQVVKVLAEHRAIIRAMVETSAFDPSAAASFHGMMYKLTRGSRRSGKLAIQAGRTRASFTPEIAETLTWTIEHACYRAFSGKPPSAKTIRQLTDTLAHICYYSAYPE